MSINVCISFFFFLEGIYIVRVIVLTISCKEKQHVFIGIKIKITFILANPHDPQKTT